MAGQHHNIVLWGAPPRIPELLYFMGGSPPHNIRLACSHFFNFIFCIFHLGTSSAFSATQRYRFVHGHVHILLPRPWGPLFFDFIFCIFHLGTSRACSATQRYRFVHGHVRILIPKPWGHHFCSFHLGTSSAFSAIQRYRFVHGHFHIIISNLWGHLF